jgi:hypothetical protein
MHLRVVTVLGFSALFAAGCATIDRFAEFRRYEEEAKGRFLGVLGFALSVPGVEDFERHYSYSADVFVIPKTSDYFGSQEELEYSRRAEEFARRYNIRLLKRKKPNKTPEPTPASVMRQPDGVRPLFAAAVLKPTT